MPDQPNTATAARPAPARREALRSYLEETIRERLGPAQNDQRFDKLLELVERQTAALESIAESLSGESYIHVKLAS